MELSKDQLDVFNAVKNKENLFITARAGCGKSFLINYIVKNIKKNYLLCASTGIASTLIGGRTIHSQFMIAPDMNYSNSLIMMSEKKKEQIKKAKILIIDEISMVSNHLLDCVDKICKEIKQENEKPFGGLQVIFCGDFIQLPPVFNNPNENFCVYSQSWKNAKIKTKLLTTNFRQEQDKDFFNILSEIRYNNLSQDSINKLKERDKIPDEKTLRLYSTNKEVDMYNEIMFNSLDYKTEHEYIMDIDGEEGYILNFLKNSLFLETLHLRLNARVMMIINEQYDDFYLCNGSLGTVVGFSKYTNLPIVNFDCGYIKEINFKTITNYEPIYNEQGELVDSKMLLKISQIPLKLAYAVSIHKSQGQTFDKVFIDCSKVFAKGQIYVALSRVKSLKGLYLKNFNPYKAKCDEIMVKSYKRLELKITQKKE